MSVRSRATTTVAAVALLLGQAAISPAFAESLDDALATAYSSNPTLQAERAQLRAVDQGLPQARAGYLPNISANGQIGTGTIDYGSGSQSVNPMGYGLTATQPLYRGGRTSASVSRAKNLILSEKARLKSVEQQILLQAATAYMNVRRDMAVLDLNVRNEKVLERELNATQDRFRVGELTLTDVAQARARAVGAKAGRIQAEGNLQASRAEYQRIIGRAAENLEEPSALQGLPTSLEEAQSMADKDNPDVVAASYVVDAAEDDVSFARGALLPTLSLNGSVQHREDFSGPGSQTDSAEIMAQLDIPLYEGGGPSAQLRQSKQVAGQRRIQLDATRRAVRAEATSGWEILSAARARVTQFESQVKANQTALQGTREQVRVGARIVLDLLNAEQELLDAQVSLEVAKRDAYVAGLQILASIGRLTARDLALNVEYYDK